MNLAKLLRAVPPKKSDPQIGDFIDGGYYFGKYQYGDGVPYWLFVAPKEAELTRAFGSGTPAKPTSASDGYANTQAMTADSFIAARYCLDYRGGGKSDWFFGSPNEMNALYRALKPSTSPNVLSGGTSNPNMIPPKGDFTTSDPQQTTLPLFVSGGSQALISNVYMWTSAALDPTGNPTRIVMSTGATNQNSSQTASLTVRPIRRVLAA